MRWQSRLLVALLPGALASCSAKPPPPPTTASTSTSTSTSKAATAATLELVESVPLETTLDHPDIPDAFEVWPAMIGAAARTLDIAEFYVSNQPASRLEPVLLAIESAADRGVLVRLLVDASFAKKYPESLERLGARRGVTVRRLDVGPLTGGVLHAKYFVVDGRDVFLGSQNFDWRALTHIQEVGARIRDERVAATYLRVFDLDWSLAVAQPTNDRLATIAEGPLSFEERTADGPVTVTPVMSPKGWVPDPRRWDLPRLVELIDGARKSVHVQVLTYDTESRDGSRFTDLDDALRRAAARGVEVSLIVSDWAKRKGPREAVKALAAVPSVSVHFLVVPAWSGGFVSFARVAHAKYLVVDGERAWVGTSNWESDYFMRSRNVGVIVEGSSFAARLERVFHDARTSRYAERVDPSGSYEPPRVGDGDGR